MEEERRQAIFQKLGMKAVGIDISDDDILQAKIDYPVFKYDADCGTLMGGRSVS